APGRPLASPPAGNLPTQPAAVVSPPLPSMACPCRLAWRSGLCAGKLDEEGRSLAIGTHHFDRPPDRVDAVGETDESRTVGRIGPSHAVVADRKLEDAFTQVDGDLHRRGVGMLGRICQRLRHDVIGGYFHGL